MTLFVCTAGTSIAGGPLRAEETAEAFRERIANHMRQRRLELPTQEAFLVRLSAETNGLWRGKAGSSDKVVFLTSETEDGRICGKALVDLVQAEFGCRARSIEVAGLQVRDGGRFRRTGIPSLFHILGNLKREVGDDDIQLNVTGGFKGTVPYIVLFGMFEAVAVTYVYEFSETLVRLPPLPVEFDWERLIPLEEAILTIGRDGAIPEADWRQLVVDDHPLSLELYDSLFEHEDGLVTLSAAGLLMSQRLEAAEIECEVRLSHDARSALASAAPDVRIRLLSMLNRVRNPLHRMGHRHSERIHGSDLRVWKDDASGGPRMLYWVQGSNVLVGELFQHHDQYEHHINRTLKSRSDYDAASFEPYDLPAALDYDTLLTELRRSTGAPDQRIAALEQEIRALRLENREVRTRRNAELREVREEGRQGAERAAEAARRRLRSELDRAYGVKLRQRDAEIAKLKVELANLRLGLQSSEGPPSTT